MKTIEDLTRAAPRCDRCRQVATGEILHSAQCPDCERSYRRCDSCGGPAGIARSLRSHRALYHPRRRG